MKLTDASSDVDGDALLDSWETDGIDFTENGSVDLDLPAMGADPEHKDIFLEIDHMPGHELSQVAIDRMIAAFAAAPVGNPDGASGVVMHVDNGPGSPMSTPGAENWDALSDADTLAHQPVIGGLDKDENYDWAGFDLVKAGNFSVDREPAFHYVVSGHRYGSAANGSSGISRGIGASDLLVTLASFSDPAEGSGTVAAQAGTLMHELGHNLGLRHGGDDDSNYKPNYLSIMNYSFQIGGLMLADGTRSLDYSRLEFPLDEAALDEVNGLGFAPGSEPGRYITAFACPDKNLLGARLAAGPLDWNCDGAIAQASVASDLNGDGATSALPSFLDWPALVFGGGSVGDAGGVALPAKTEMIEPQKEELLANEAALQAAANRVGPPVPGVPTAAPPAAKPVGVAAPRTSLSGPKTQKLGPSISVTVSCSEACAASAVGTVPTPGAKPFKLSSGRPVSIREGGDGDPSVEALEEAARGRRTQIGRWRQGQRDDRRHGQQRERLRQRKAHAQVEALRPFASPAGAPYASGSTAWAPMSLGAPLALKRRFVAQMPAGSSSARVGSETRTSPGRAASASRAAMLTSMPK